MSPDTVHNIYTVAVLSAGCFTIIEILRFTGKVVKTDQAQAAKQIELLRQQSDLLLQIERNTRRQ